MKKMKAEGEGEDFMTRSNAVMADNWAFELAVQEMEKEAVK